MPHEAAIARVIRETGMERMQAINHLRGREAAQEAETKRRYANLK